MDPIVKPYESGYASFSNNPIALNDPLGLDPDDPNDERYHSNPLNPKSELGSHDVELSSGAEVISTFSSNYGRLNDDKGTIIPVVRGAAIKFKDVGGTYSARGSASRGFIGYYNDVTGARYDPLLSEAMNAMRRMQVFGQIMDDFQKVSAIAIASSFVLFAGGGGVLGGSVTRGAPLVTGALANPRVQEQLEHLGEQPLLTLETEQAVVQTVERVTAQGLNTSLGQFLSNHGGITKASEFFGWGKTVNFTKSIDDFSRSYLEANGWFKEDLLELARVYSEQIQKGGTWNEAAYVRTQRTLELIEKYFNK